MALHIVGPENYALALLEIKTKLKTETTKCCIALI